MALLVRKDPPSIALQDGQALDAASMRWSDEFRTRARGDLIDEVGGAFFDFSVPEQDALITERAIAIVRSQLPILVDLILGHLYDQFERELPAHPSDYDHLGQFLQDNGISESEACDARRLAKIIVPYLRAWFERNEPVRLGDRVCQTVDEWLLAAGSSKVRRAVSTLTALIQSDKPEADKDAQVRLVLLTANETAKRMEALLTGASRQIVANVVRRGDRYQITFDLDELGYMLLSRKLGKHLTVRGGTHAEC